MSMIISSIYYRYFLCVQYDRINKLRLSRFR
nr:MAG TPA: hypothetical protein [Caudoviricetes sp.]